MAGMKIVGPTAGLGFRIEHIWAFLAIDGDDDEAVVAAQIGGQWMPLIAADETRLGDLRVIAQQIAEAQNKPIRLVRFDSRTDVELL